MLARGTAGLFLDMGGGKTVSTLTTLDQLDGRTLLVGPIRVIESVWRQEAEKWGINLTFSLVRGTPAERTTALRTAADVYLINPENLTWFFDLPDKSRPSMKNLVIDESSMFKTPGSKRFRKLRHQVRRFDRRFILTGTPSPNSLLDLWSQIYIIDGGRRLGTSFNRYKQQYFYPVDRMGWKWTVKPGAETEIYRMISDIILRIEVPRDYKSMFNRLNLDLDPKTRKLYDEMEEEAFAQIDDNSSVSAMTVAVAMVKCRQLANGVTYTDEGGVSEVHQLKLDALSEIVEGTGSPVLVVYNFRHELEVIRNRFKDLVVLSEDPTAIDRWNKGEIPVMALHPQSGGHGLNLQFGGHTIVWYGLTFSYEQFAQTNARLIRPGQEHTVMIHLVVAKNTVDIVMGKTLKLKNKGQTGLLNAMKEYRNDRRNRRA